MNFNMIIMRGVSGAGKTTFVKEVEKFIGDPFLFIHCSADHSMVDMNGEYKFSPAKLSQAHAECFRLAVTEAMVCWEDQAASRESNQEWGGSTIVIDNTNLEAWEVSPYILLANAYGYKVTLVKLLVDPKVAAERNVHGVDLKNITRMQNKNQRLPPHFPKEFVYANPTTEQIHNLLEELKVERKK